jgi:hypothetical protein
VLNRFYSEWIDVNLRRVQVQVAQDREKTIESDSVQGLSGC